MADRGAAERACKDANPIIDGRKANVNLAYLGAKPRSSQAGECRTAASGASQQVQPVAASSRNCCRAGVQKRSKVTRQRNVQVSRRVWESGRLVLFICLICFTA